MTAARVLKRRGSEKQLADASFLLRESRGLNRTRLAQLSGVSLRTLEDWEAGRRVPRDVYQIHAVAAALGMSIEDYLGL